MPAPHHTPLHDEHGSHRKRRADGPAGLFATEAAGLRWIDVPGGPRVVRVLGEHRDGLDLEWLSPASPTVEAARAFGTALARLHDAGAPTFGALPPGAGPTGFFGPLDQPLPMPGGDHDRWGEFYARRRIEPMTSMLADRGLLAPALERDLGRVTQRLRDGRWDDDEAPARLHGDLWSGNVMWTGSDGAAGPAVTAVLIDPAAHGGHRLTDLAMLALFGLPHLPTVQDAYRREHPLPDGWRDLLPLHQLYPVGMHAVLFGAGYLGALGRIVARYA